MLFNLLKVFSGRPQKRFLKSVEPLVKQINALEEEYQALTEEALRSKTEEFKQRFRDGESLDAILPEAFAVVKNAARRLVGTKVNVCDHELTWDMVHFDVQLIGGLVLHQGKIAEMATGEGKTLVSTLPLYLNALTGRNCQLVTVNDYLVRRDSQWMGHLFKYLGLSVGYLQNSMGPEERKVAYAADITYGTASEFGFDYLRDNGMATRSKDQVQRDHFYCIIDEVDSILIDEARTPLIISGPVKAEREAPFQALRSGVERLVGLQTKFCNSLANEAKGLLEQETEEGREQAMHQLLQVRMGMPHNKTLLRLMENGTYRKWLDKFEVEMNSDFRKTELFELKEGLYFVIDEKQHQSDLTEKGRETLQPNNPDAFVLPDLPTYFMELDKRTDLTPEKRQELKLEAEHAFQKLSEEIHCLSQLLRAYCLYERDVEYVVQDGKVVIVDENTGRLMPGRRWGDGLHQAVEAKENVIVQEESKTFATITMQNYFRMYDKLAGMTGTAETEATEFYDIYKLTVMPVPTHRPCIRKDCNDEIYKSRREKYNAVIKDIQEAHKKGQPVLVGTTSVDASEVLHRMLRRENIAHSVLNAKYHEQEAEIVSRAGQRGAVTIATNMAGRGTDIKLGDGVAGLGGLLVLGTERHESRRVDRQLRGRCSRQGDPGMSKFYISLEDDLMRLFANAGPISRILEKSFKEGEMLEHPLLNRSIESAQKKVEEHNYAIRKRLLKYDDVLNQQREVIYGLRNDAMHSNAPREIVYELIEEELEERLAELDGKGQGIEGEDLRGFLHWVNGHFPVAIRFEEAEGKSIAEMGPFILERIQVAYQQKEAVEEPTILQQLERYTVIQPIDKHWQDHLTEMEELRRSVGLRSYGQKDPLNEYKSEAFTYFEEMMRRIRHDIAIGIFRSASNLEAFQNMLARLSKRAQATGPASEPAMTALSGAVQGGAPRDMIKKGSASAQQSQQTARPSKISTVRNVSPKVGRNDPCPCGSGKKFKKCCGKDA